MKKQLCTDVQSCLLFNIAIWLDLPFLQWYSETINLTPKSEIEAEDTAKQANCFHVSCIFRDAVFLLGRLQ